MGGEVGSGRHHAGAGAGLGLGGGVENRWGLGPCLGVAVAVRGGPAERVAWGGEEGRVSPPPCGKR